MPPPTGAKQAGGAPLPDLPATPLLTLSRRLLLSPRTSRACNSQGMSGGALSRREARVCLTAALPPFSSIHPNPASPHLPPSPFPSRILLPFPHPPPFTPSPFPSRIPLSLSPPPFPSTIPLLFPHPLPYPPPPSLPPSPFPSPISLPYPPPPSLPPSPFSFPIPLPFPHPPSLPTSSFPFPILLPLPHPPSLPAFPFPFPHPLSLPPSPFSFPIPLPFPHPPSLPPSPFPSRIPFPYPRPPSLSPSPFPFPTPSFPFPHPPFPLSLIPSTVLPRFHTLCRQSITFPLPPCLLSFPMPCLPSGSSHGSPRFPFVPHLAFLPCLPSLSSHASPHLCFSTCLPSASPLSPHLLMCLFQHGATKNQFILQFSFYFAFGEGGAITAQGTWRRFLEGEEETGEGREGGRREGRGEREGERGKGREKTGVSAAGGGSGFGLVVTQRTARVVSADEEACWAVGMEREELLRASLFDLAEKLNPAEWVRAVEGMSAKDRPRVIVRFRLVQPSNHRGGNGGGSGALSGRRVDCELQELVPNSKAMRVHIAPIPPNSPGGGGGGGGGEKPVAPTTPRAGLSHSKTLSRAETMSSQQAPSLSHSHTLAHSPSSLGGKQGASRVTFGGEHGGRGGGGSDVGDYGGQARERERGRRGAAEAGAAHGGKLVPGERGAPVAALRGRAQAEGEVQGEREGEAGRQCQNWKRAAAGLNEGEAEAGGRLRVGAWRG
ncbi:unnamed protein product [Closterium sp. NIES-65]|nr:unnamed protein product [Closterium sp. NIES-65]